jgi:hypothetical protein
LTLDVRSVLLEEANRSTESAKQKQLTERQQMHRNSKWTELLQTESIKRSQTNLSHLRARLTAEETGEILGFQKADIPILVKAKLLKPLARPKQQSTKYFAYIDVHDRVFDSDWLNNATQVVYDYWGANNSNKRKPD